MTTDPSTWTAEHSIDADAGPQTLWTIFCDVDRWKEWNAGIEHVAIDGSFADGTWFTMKPPGQDSLRSRLVDVRENERFVDETQVGELVVRVTHRLEPLGDARTRVVYAVEARGPGAAEIGPAISADFPEVLAALAKRAAERQS